MRQRLDIADVEASTKIRAKYLRALENEEFGMLPGPTFVKTFLRTYAEALGLDPAPPRRGVPGRLRGGRRRRTHPVARAPEPRARPCVGAARVSGRARCCCWSWWRWWGRSWRSACSRTAATTTAARWRARRPRARRRPSARQQPERRRPTRVVLRITPLTPTYVCVDRGSGTPVLFENTIDSPQTFRGKRVRVNLGKTDVQIQKNGRRVPVASGPDPVGFEFTVRGRRPLPLGERPCA